ncbi:hypothetical protein E3N88_18605 [Mikania micrantha]|uniref:Reverse transcriptase domain-containing protein n=1 Tax=Mikania micrantha TaxID=192012 RepID=A0A5N6NMB1_9ASTR|nr:hypothetical protein E3N88_18605 [Mikania micrantha]
MQFIERSIEIMDQGVKKLKHSRIPIVKVRWEGKRGAEFTWEREDQMKLKYPHLFTSITLGKNNIVLYRNSGGLAANKAGSWTLNWMLYGNMDLLLINFTSIGHIDRVIRFRASQGQLRRP